MEVASNHHHLRTFAPYSRSNTPSSSTTRTPAPMSHPGSQYSSYSQQSRSSGSTQDTSSSTLFAAPPSLPTQTPPPNGGPVSATDNVINKVALQETSLFHSCTILKNRLTAIPGFEEDYLQINQIDADEPLDPVTQLWRCFRDGYPLLRIVNTLRPDNPIEVDGGSTKRKDKVAAFKFINACKAELDLANDDDCPILADLYGDDTSGFVKIVNVAHRFVDLLIAKGLIDSYDSSGDSRDGIPLSDQTESQRAIDELVRTERTYVQHLEILQQFKKLVEVKGILPGDVIHDIFLNINALLDFQRRFLIRVEQTNESPESDQNWGSLFIMYGASFRVYEPYLVNQKKAETTVQREFDKLRETGGAVEMQQLVESPSILNSFLVKPFQRLSKYPLLLDRMAKGDIDEQRKKDLKDGKEAVMQVLENSNKWIAQEEKKEAVQALKGQVEDWRNHKVEHFGELLLHGAYTVIKGDGQHSEREYKIYLFERILLCCKEINPHKQKNRLVNRNQPLVDKNGRPKMQLKGRIFMQNVTETIFLSKPGSYTCQIFWRGDDTIEYFVIRFPTEEIMKEWRSAIERQRVVCQNQVRQLGLSTSETEFNYIRDQGQLDNPYRDEEHEEDEYEVVQYGDAEPAMSRNGSSTSLRSRSTTGESGPPVQRNARHQPPGYPGQPLSLKTNYSSSAVSPGEHPGNSYFSPTVDSPISSRTSSSSGMFAAFQRQQTPQNGWHHEDSNRYTAPAMGRPYPSDKRGASNQGQPPHPSSLSQMRSRSASSPNIPSLNQPNGRIPANAPPVPTVPAHIAQAQGLNRSQNNSPIQPNGVPSRVGTASPNSAFSHGQTSYHSHHPSSGYDAGHANTSMHSQLPSQSLSSTRTPANLDAMLDDELPTPSQIKVKVKTPSVGSTMTLVVPFNIKYGSLKDRIDAKLKRHTNLSLGSGKVRLKYLYDGEFISITTDDDVREAFDLWREQQTQSDLAGNQLGEIELYCHN